MIDRNVEFPSRYHITKVDGTDDVYELVPAPGTVSAEGTPINKATLLTDTTAMLYGLDNTAVPDDVLKKLANAAFVENGSLTDVGGNSVGVQIAIGSYTGNGKYGESNPNSLTFGFVPKIVFISGNSSSSLRLYQGSINVVNEFGNAFSIPYSSSSNVYAYGWYVSVTNNQVSWYTEFSSPEYQMNDSNSTYYYIAIG